MAGKWEVGTREGNEQQIHCSLQFYCYEMLETPGALGTQVKINPWELCWSRGAEEWAGKTQFYFFFFFNIYRLYLFISCLLYQNNLGAEGLWREISSLQTLCILLLKSFLVDLALSFCKIILWCWVVFLTLDKGNGFLGKMSWEWAMGWKVWFCLLVEEESWARNWHHSRFGFH